MREQGAGRREPDRIIEVAAGCFASGAWTASASRT